MRTLCAVVLAMAACTAQAQSWPAQPIRIVASVAPGSSTDLLARLAARGLSASLGQPVTVENRPGVGGTLGAREVKDAAPDGHTLLATSVALVINGTLYEKPGYDVLRDFAGVALAGTTANVITVNPSVLATSLPELFELAKRERLAYSSSGIGTTTHLSMERLKGLYGAPIAHVARQPAQAVEAAQLGTTAIAATSLPPAIPAIRAGRLRPIAVTSARRVAALPDVPTVAEAGHPGFDDVTWFGFFVPARVPAAVLERLNQATNQSLQNAEAKAKLGQLGLEHRPLSAAAFAAFLRDETAKWAKAVRDSGARPE